MIERIKYRLQTDKELLLLSILSLGTLALRLLALLTNVRNCMAIYSSIYVPGVAILNIVPAVLFFLYIASNYKTDKNTLLKATIISYFVMFAINFICNFYGGTLIATIFNSAWYIYLFVLICKGYKNETTFKNVKIITIVYASLVTIKCLANLHNSIKYIVNYEDIGEGILRILSALFNMADTLLFIGIVFYISKNIIPKAKNSILKTRELLLELKKGYEQGILTDEEYHQKKREILNKM